MSTSSGRTPGIAAFTSIESSVLITVNLVDLGVAHIWVKAITPAHGKILRSPHARARLTRLDLAGLTLQEAQSLVDAVAGTVVPAEGVADWLTGFRPTFSAGIDGKKNGTDGPGGRVRNGPEI